MKRRILDATAASANSSGNGQLPVTAVAGSEPSLKRARYDEYSAFTDIATLDLNTLRVQNTELFAKVRQQKAELARFGEELSRHEALVRSWQRIAQDLQHSISQFHTVVQSQLPTLTAVTTTTNGGAQQQQSVVNALWSAAERKEEPINADITQAAVVLTQDSRELLALIIDCVQRHEPMTVNDEVKNLRKALSEATAKTLSLEHDLHHARQAQSESAPLQSQCAELEERLEREQRNTHRLQLQLAQQQEQHERQLREAQQQLRTASSSSNASTASASTSSSSTSTTMSGALSEEYQSELRALQDVLAVRQQAIEELRAEKASLSHQLDAERMQQYSVSVGDAWDARVRQSALYRATEERVAYFESLYNNSRTQLDEARQELQQYQTQRRHDNEQRNRLQQAQLVTQEEKIQAMEARLKKLQSEKESLAHELELKKADKPGAQLLRQLTDELSAHSKRTLEIQEQKAAFLERISDLKRTISRLERGLASESADVLQRLEAQEKENETLLGEMGNMESELTRVQQENTRLLRQLAESEESRLHHTLERASWTKAQQGASKKSEIEKEKSAKLEERMKFQETTLQQMQAKTANLEQQLRIKSDSLGLLQQRIETNEKANGDVVLLAHDLEQRLEEVHSALQQYQSKFNSEMESKEALHKEMLMLKEELAISNSRRGTKGGAMKGGSGDSSSYLEQQMESYKKALRCSVCNDRNKNTVITRCYHCFCKECVEDNLEKRIRKCPACSASFGDKDVHALWF